MVEYHPTEQQLDQVFHALADGTRRAMLADLVSGPQSVGSLAAPHDMSLAAASKHVKVLERAGLLRREIDGRTHHCHLEGAPLQDGVAWIQRIEAFWTRRLDQLEAALREADTNPGPRTDPPRSQSSRTRRENGDQTS